MLGFASPKPSFLKIDNGIKLILAPRLDKDFSNIELPIDHGIVKLFGSFSFGGNFLWWIALHSSEKAPVSYSPSYIFFTRMSFMKLAYEGICSNALANRILM